MSVQLSREKEIEEVKEALEQEGMSDFTVADNEYGDFTDIILSSEYDRDDIMEVGIELDAYQISETKSLNGETKEYRITI